MYVKFDSNYDSEVAIKTYSNFTDKLEESPEDLIKAKSRKPLKSKLKVLL